MHYSIHAGDIFIDKGADLQLERGSVGDEIFTERRQGVQGFQAAPKKSHMRRKDFVTGAHQVITAKCLNVDGPMRTIVNGIEKHLCAGSMSTP